jgi:hypothetical protein
VKAIVGSMLDQFKVTCSLYQEMVYAIFNWVIYSKKLNRTKFQCQDNFHDWDQFSAVQRVGHSLCENTRIIRECVLIREICQTSLFTISAVGAPLLELRSVCLMYAN